MNVFNIIERDDDLKERAIAGGVYPANDKYTQQAIIIEGVFASNLKERSIKNRTAKTTGERRASFGSGASDMALDEWASSSEKEDVKRAYTGLKAQVSRGFSTANNGSIRKDDFVVMACIAHGLNSTAELEEWLSSDD